MARSVAAGGRTLAGAALVCRYVVLAAYFARERSGVVSAIVMSVSRIWSNQSDLVYFRKQGTADLMSVRPPPYIRPMWTLFCSVFCSVFRDFSALHFGPFRARDLCQTTAISIRMYNSPIETTSVTYRRVQSAWNNTTERNNCPPLNTPGHARRRALQRGAPLQHGDRNSDGTHPPRATHSRVRQTADHD